MKIEEIYKLYKESEGITTDTRNINLNCIFFALKGENFDGNKFAHKAIELGASFSVIDDKRHNTSDKTILVDNVLKTLQQLANYHRKQLSIPVIALTGSNGKTTTKELINVVLAKKYRTTATIGNLNNHIGVPLTILSFTKDTEIGIVEMGANHQKEIEFLASITEPNYGYITNFGKAHLEGFGGFEGVIKGKTELYNHLISKKQKAFINSEDAIQLSYVSKLDSIIINSDIALNNIDPFLTFTYKGTAIITNLIGAYNFPNISAAIAIGEYFKVPINDIKSALESYIPTNNRSQIITKGSSRVILDAYNANPSSMKAALENFEHMEASKKTIILGDMFELGDTSINEHQGIVTLAEQLNFQNIYLIGEHFNKTKSKTANIYPSFESFKSSGVTLAPATYLIKGSRGMALERILDLFEN